MSNSNLALDVLVPDAATEYDIPSFLLRNHTRQPTEAFDICLKFGVSLIKNKENDSRLPFDTKSLMQFALGAGVQWRFAQRYFVRGEVDSYDRDANFIGVSIGAYLSGHEKHDANNPAVD